MIEKLRKLRTTFVKLLFFTLLASFSSELLAQQECTTMPEPVAYTQVSSTTSKVVEYATIRGVRVTRTMTTRGNNGDQIMYSNQDYTPTETYCGKNRKNTFGNKHYPFMDSNKVFKIVYEFSKPVNDVEMFLAAFGFNGARESWKSTTPHLDVVQFSVNKGEIQLIRRSVCEGVNVSINGSTVSSVDTKTTDVKVGITSSIPFTELTLQYLEPSGQTGGYGFFPEICLASVVTPISDSNCTVPNTGDPFSTFPIDTKTINDISVKRTVDSGIGASGSFPGSHCGGSAVTYPSKDPLLKDNKKIVYEFGAPIKSAEIFLLAFGDNQAVNTFDKTQFEVDGGGTISLSKTYDCNPIASSINGNIVSSVNNRKLTTDVAIKISSDKPFSKITVTDRASTGHGYLVALCPLSVTKATDSDLIVLDAAASTLTNQTVCEGEAPTTYKAKANATAFASTAKFDYVLEVKKSGTTNWVAVETKSNVTPGTLHTFTGEEFKKTNYNNAKVRVKYVYKNSLFSSVTGTVYSNEATLTVKEKASITSLIASPTSLNETGATNIVYTIKGTPGATVTYNINGTTGTKVLDSTGNGTVPANNQSVKTTLTITKVEKTGLCSRENLTYKAEVDHQGNGCTSHPTPQFPKGNNTKATLNGVEVTRTLDGTPNYFPTQTYLSQYNLCTPTLIDGHPAMNEHGFNKVTYTFAKPITKIQVWLSGFGSTEPSKLDEAEFSIDCATANLSLSITDCNNTPEATLVTKSGGRITSNSTKYFQAIVQVTADKPFTKLEVKKGTVNGFRGYGYVVELCPTSLQLPKITVTQDPAEQKACAGRTGVTFSANAKIAGITGNLGVQWERTKTPTTETSWVSAPGTASGTVKADGTGSTTLTLGTITATDENFYYRAKFTYSECGANITKTSGYAKLIFVAPSDVITINTPNYSNISNVCTETKTINAKATIAPAYVGNIKNLGGGNFFSYELQYKASGSTSWVNYELPSGGALQTYSNNPSGKDRTFTIDPANVESGATFRVKYTASITTLCDDITVYSNEFTFTKKAPTTITTQPIARELRLPPYQ